MQTWAKRGLNAALLTGGLFMLGTGIASATENVSPDVQPTGIDALLRATPRVDTPSDALVSAPVQIENNSVQSPLGSIDPFSASGNIEIGSGLPSKANQLTQALAGTTTVATVGAPVQVVNNGVGVLQNVSATGESTLDYSNPTPVTTDGAGQTLQGNVVRVNDLLPMQLANNAVAVGADASASGTATETAVGGGDITTSGQDGKLSGNILDQRYAIPLGVGGNALAVGGKSTAASSTTQTATNDATDSTNGEDGFLAGNVANNPAALPFVANSNAGSLVGKAFAINADNASVDGACGSITAPNESATTATAIGDTYAAAPNSVASGNVFVPQTAIATGVYAAATTVFGKAEAAHVGDATAQAYGDTYADGTGGTISGNTVAAPVAAVPDVVALAGSFVGNAVTAASETRVADAGGYNGSLGDDSILSGNVVQSPFAAPVEAIGNVVTGAGDSSSNATSTTTVGAGEHPNSNDDNGKISSNVAQFANAVPVLINGFVVPIGGDAEACAQIESTTKAGLPAETNGKDSTLSGNILAESASFPVLIQEMVQGGFGDGLSHVDSMVDSQAGGSATTTGESSAGSGNIAALPIAGGFQNAAINTAVVGTAAGNLLQDTTSIAGGPNTTNGDHGQISGLIADVPLVPRVGSLGHAFTVLGESSATSDAVTTVASGGDDTTSGVNGALAGDIAQVPGGAVVSWFACVMTALGNTSDSTSSDVMPTQLGGDMTTDGTNGTLSGDIFNPGVKGLTGLASDAITIIDGDATGNGVNGFDGAPGGTATTAGDGLLNGMAMFDPIIINAPLKELVIPLGGNASATNVDNPGEWAEGTAMPLDLSAATGLMGATELPTLPRYQREDVPAGGLLSMLPALASLQLGKTSSLPLLNGFHL